MLLFDRMALLLDAWLVMDDVSVRCSDVFLIGMALILGVLCLHSKPSRLYSKERMVSIYRTPAFLSLDLDLICCVPLQPSHSGTNGVF